NSTNRPYKIETFLIGDVLMNQSTASRLDHTYFNNIDGSAISICTGNFNDPQGNVFYIDDDHLNYYGLVRNYPCDYVELTIAQTDISFNIAIPKVGDTITITATVNNDGNNASTNVKVQFFNGDPDSGGTQIGSNQTIDSIAAGGSDNAIETWTATSGTIAIYVRVDPDNDYFEPNELNNEASKVICVNYGLEVTIQNPSDGFSTDNCNSTAIDINATLQDTCFNTLVGANATVTANISTDGPIAINDTDEDYTYYANWGPIINGSTMINISALGNVATWQNLYGENNVSGLVSNCTG
ncbi:MAG: CARDB domain-containing protein, partial [Thermodesulfobacteriota bacterium]